MGYSITSLLIIYTFYREKMVLNLKCVTSLSKNSYSRTFSFKLKFSALPALDALSQILVAFHTKCAVVTHFALGSEAPKNTQIQNLMKIWILRDNTHTNGPKVKMKK